MVVYLSTHSCATGMGTAVMTPLPSYTDEGADGDAANSPNLTLTGAEAAAAAAVAAVPAFESWKKIAYDFASVTKQTLDFVEEDSRNKLLLEKSQMFIGKHEKMSLVDPKCLQFFYSTY